MLRASSGILCSQLQCSRCQGGLYLKVLTRKRRILEKYDISYPQNLPLLSGQSDTYFPVLKKKKKKLGTSVLIQIKRCIH